MTQTCKIMLFSVAALMVGIFVPISRYRLINGDEGIYVLASRLVLEHRVPYRDFMYLQTPLLPYVYGLWMKMTGLSWISARMLSGLLTALLGTLIYADATIHSRKYLAGICAGILFASCTLIFPWLPIVKTYSISAPFLFFSYMIVSRRYKSMPQLACAACGLFLGVAVDTRSYLIGLIPIFLWWIYREIEVAKRRSALLWFAVGFAAAILPNLYFLCKYTRAFVFGNFGFHAARSHVGIIGDYSQKLVILARAVAMGGPEANGLQVAILVTLSLISTAGKTTPATRLAFRLAAGLSLISLIPTPTFVEYFCIATPLLITATVCSTNDFLDSFRLGRTRKILTSVLLGCLALFVCLSFRDARRFLVTGEGITRSAEDAINWKISTVSAVSRAIDQVTYPGESVMCFWPGYLLESKALPLSGFENNFGMYISWALSADDLAEFHVLSHQRVDDEIEGRLARVVVLGNQDYVDEHIATYSEKLRMNGYVPIRSIAGASIYLRHDATAILNDRDRPD